MIKFQPLYFSFLSLKSLAKTKENGQEFCFFFSILVSTKDDVRESLPQTIAEMLVARLFNEKQNTGIVIVYGAAM